MDDLSLSFSKEPSIAPIDLNAPAPLNEEEFFLLSTNVQDHDLTEALQIEKEPHVENEPSNEQIGDETTQIPVTDMDIDEDFPLVNKIIVTQPTTVDVETNGHSKEEEEVISTPEKVTTLGKVSNNNRI